MAIVNEDPAMVKFFLDMGADFHQRCCGNFFTPDDQKLSRRDSLEHEWFDVCLKTNYAGFVTCQSRRQPRTVAEKNSQCKKNSSQR